MSNAEIRQSGRDDDGQCPAGEDVAEAFARLMELRAEYDEKIAERDDRIAHLETRAAANTARLDQLEGFVASMGSFSKLLAGEADRVSSA